MKLKTERPCHKTGYCTPLFLPRCKYEWCKIWQINNEAKGVCQDETKN